MEIIVKWKYSHFIKMFDQRSQSMVNIELSQLGEEKQSVSFCHGLP